MFPELDKVITRFSGLACIDCDSVLSPLFLQLYFLDNFIRNNTNLIIVSNYLSLDALKFVF